jgi:Na+/melibiose symporter-like transporter
MSANANRALMLLGVGLALFGISIVILTRLLPGPHTERDYFIIGCLATLISLLAVFLIVISTWIKTPNPFYKRRSRSR